MNNLTEKLMIKNVLFHDAIPLEEQNELIRNKINDFISTADKYFNENEQLELQNSLVYIVLISLSFNKEFDELKYNKLCEIIDFCELPKYNELLNILSGNSVVPDLLYESFLLRISSNKEFFDDVLFLTVDFLCYLNKDINYHNTICHSLNTIKDTKRYLGSI